MTGGSNRAASKNSFAKPIQRAALGLRLRIALPLLFPVLGLLALSAVLLVQKQSTVTAMTRVGTLTHLVTDASALVHEVQRERGASSGFLASKGTDLVQDLKDQRTRTDATLAAFASSAQTVVADGTVTAGSSLSGSLAAARNALLTVDAIRRQIDQLSMMPEESFNYFTSANAKLLDMVGETGVGVDAPDVASAISTYLSFLQAKELAGQERALATAGFAAGRFDAVRLRHLMTLRDQQDLYFRMINRSVTPAQSEFMQHTLSGAVVDTVAHMRDIAADGGRDGKLDGITAASWFKAATARIELLKKIEDRMATDLGELARAIRDSAATSLYQTVVAIVILLVLTTLVGILTIRAIVRPLGAHIATMRSLAAGDTTLVVHGTDRTDELGSMARAIAIFRDNALDNQRLAAAQEHERVRAETDKMAALNAMADTIESETTRALGQVSQQTIAMEATADNMNASAERNGVSAQRAVAAASQALVNAQTVASAADQLAASIREIAGQISRSTAVVNRAVEAGDNTRETINQLDGKVAQIGSVADMIRDIAAKTNLLALNATIEAARAGEAGKGFAVVASEVKALANQTARSTEEISRHLADVKASTTESVAAVGRIGDTITELNTVASSIAAAVEEQGAATAEIARSVTRTAQAADEVTGQIQDISKEAEESRSQAGRVHEHAVELSVAVSDLKRTVIRVVRTFSTEVNRRQMLRYKVALDGQIAVAGRPTGPVHILELSELGAAISPIHGLATGSHGTLYLPDTDAGLPFVIRNQFSGRLGLSFDANETAQAAVRRILSRYDARDAA